MEAQLVDLEVKKTARLAVYGRPGPQVRECVVFAHGYGHLAPYFIRSLQTLQKPDRLIVCPEGLSRFYLSGAAGRVGASWMTKEARETDISDYLAYLERVWEWVGERCPGVTCRSMAGFSQGAATAARYAFHAPERLNKLILCSGAFPPDILWPESQSVPFQTFFIYGEQDPYLAQFPPEKLFDLPTFRGLTPKVMPFAGVHELNSPLMEIALTCA